MLRLHAGSNSRRSASHADGVIHVSHARAIDGGFLWGQYNYVLERLQLVSEGAGVSEL
jgi:hypothetical protein